MHLWGSKHVNEFSESQNQKRSVAVFGDWWDQSNSLKTGCMDVVEKWKHLITELYFISIPLSKSH